MGRTRRFSRPLPYQLGLILHEQVSPLNLNPAFLSIDFFSRISGKLLLDTLPLRGGLEGENSGSGAKLGGETGNQATIQDAA